MFWHWFSNDRIKRGVWETEPPSRRRRKIWGVITPLIKGGLGLVKGGYFKRQKVLGHVSFLDHYSMILKHLLILSDHNNCISGSQKLIWSRSLNTMRKCIQSGRRSKIGRKNESRMVLKWLKKAHKAQCSGLSLNLPRLISHIHYSRLIRISQYGDK